MENKMITEWTHIVRPGADDCHYRGYLVAGTRLLQYVTDCVACIGSAREGRGGSLVNINANFRAPVYAMEELHVKVKLESVGNTSRKYSFTIHKTISYSSETTPPAKVLDEPILCVDGTCVDVHKH